MSKTELTFRETNASYMAIQPTVRDPVPERTSKGGGEGDTFRSWADHEDRDHSHWTEDPVTVALTHIVYADR